MPDTPCPWCKEPYQRFIPEDEIPDGFQFDAVTFCRSGLGIWIHETGGETA